MGEKTCCVTGHRDVPVGKEQYVEEALRKEVLAAIAAGYTRFISGFADGVDLTFAAIVAAEKKQNSCLQLEAALPYRNRINAKSPLFQELLACCDRVYVQSEKSNRQCYHERNRYMVLSSDRVIAVYDGRSTGGTFYTIRFAQANEKKFASLRYNPWDILSQSSPAIDILVCLYGRSYNIGRRKPINFYRR